jgi:hypothetical protein
MSPAKHRGANLSETLVHFADNDRANHIMKLTFSTVEDTPSQLGKEGWRSQTHPFLHPGARLPELPAAEPHDSESEEPPASTAASQKS